MIHSSAELVSIGTVVSYRRNGVVRQHRILDQRLGQKRRIGRRSLEATLSVNGIGNFKPGRYPHGDVFDSTCAIARLAGLRKLPGFGPNPHAAP